MYTKEIERILSAKRINIGDWIRVVSEKETYEGVLMPRSVLGDASIIVIKLDNGYNVGVKYKKGMKLELLKRGKSIKFAPSKKIFEKDLEKPNVSILGCGGTIASRVEYTTGAVFPAFSPNDLILAFPELKEIANVNGRKIFNLLSEDMTAQHWKIIAREVVKELPKVDGVVLMHGTDTLHYTAAALSFMLQNLPKPVVLVGAQRSSDRGSSDNLVNTICSVLTATKSDIAEVTVCMHSSSSDETCFVHQGTRVRKMHTSRRDAFRSIKALPYAKVYYRKRSIEYIREDFRKRSAAKAKLVDKMNENVALIHIHPMIKPDFIESLKKFYDGIVIAGTGLGHVPTNPFNDKFAKSIVPALKSLIASGIPVVIAPQTLCGRLNLKVYTAGRLLNEIGVIGDGADWLPEVAYVKLMWVLGQTKNMKKVRELMLTSVAGEISERSVEDAFLV
jgi:glutamyl-tRNA(Gln) amidotransferase subunit D